MYDKCFMCLNNTSNKICSTCNCFCHPKCWGKYLQNITTITTIIYPNHCSIMVPYSTECPICKKDIGNVKSLTRNDTYIGRKQYFTMNIRNTLLHIKLSPDIETKEKLAKLIFNLIIDNKKMMKDCGLENVVKDLLNHLYHNKNWTPANIYHLRIFGEQLVN